MLGALSQKRTCHLDRTGPAWVEANHLRQVERPKHKPTPTTVFKLAVLDAVFVSLTFQLRDFTNELYVWEKHWLGKECKTETYSRLKLRQRGLKLWCDQLKWLIFDIKLLVSTAENILAIKKCADLGGVILSGLFCILTWWLGVKCLLTNWTKTYQRERWSLWGFHHPLVSTLWAVLTSTQCPAAWCNLWSRGQKNKMSFKMLT